MKTGDLTARWAALGFIEKILDDKLPLDQAFDHICQRFSGKLSQRDRAFVRHLGTTCLRHLGQLDAMINHCTPKNLGLKQKSVRNILRLALTQMLYMTVADHGAVNSAVEMIGKNYRTRPIKGMANAVLRRIARDRERFLSDFAPELNIPSWLRQAWIRRFGKRMVIETAGILLKEPPLDFTLKPGCDGAEWAEKLGGILLPNGSLRLEKPGPVQNLPGYDDGVWWIQDVAASLPAMILGAKAGDHVLELCAAPGGKTAQLAARGCEVVAVDQSVRRMKRLRQNMARLDLCCDVVTSDAAEVMREISRSKSGKYCHILLDAPCSSTGTLRRHPDVSQARSMEDIEALAKIQANLLDGAVQMMPVGAVLVYCVCSLQAQEGPDQIKALLERHGSVKRNRIRLDELAGFEDSLLENGDIQTLPYHMPGGMDGGMDGFFISRLVRISG